MIFVVLLCKIGKEISKKIEGVKPDWAIYTSVITKRTYRNSFMLFDIRRS